jgi:acetyl-CoA acetyltransferase
VPYGGAGSMAVLLHAAMAVSTGVAKTVVCYRALNARSGSRFGRASTESRGQTTHAGTTAAQWCMPFGVLTPASWMALNVVRYMQASGATSEDFGRAVVATRRYAAANPDAWYYQRPITLDDHQNSRWIVEPCMRLLDCCQETDGSVAIVVTAADRARDLPSLPVRIASAGMSAVPDSEVASDHYRPDLAVFANPKAFGPRLFEAAGVTRSDIDAAMIYDAFSPLLLMQLEALGFCEPGEARHFIADGNLELDGLLPCNTNGGLIGEGYIHGVNLVIEAVRQLRGSSRSQVHGVEHVLVSSARSGAVLSK